MVCEQRDGKSRDREPNAWLVSISISSISNQKSKRKRASRRPLTTFEVWDGVAAEHAQIEQNTTQLEPSRDQAFEITFFLLGAKS